jgi:hypothetical protein
MILKNRQKKYIIILTKGLSMREKYQVEIEKKIKQFEPGYVFSAIDFREIADTDPVNKALSRLNETGEIRRIIQGLYDKPVHSKILNEKSAPDIEKVAKALARKYNWTIAPSGETALNYLHMSTQVSNAWCYISDGPYRKYEIEPFVIEFRHCANKEISGRSLLTIIVIQALKHIGKGKVTREDIERLTYVLNDKDKEMIFKESISTTSWIYNTIREVCDEKSSVIQ